MVIPLPVAKSKQKKRFFCNFFQNCKHASPKRRSGFAALAAAVFYVCPPDPEAPSNPRHRFFAHTCTFGIIQYCAKKIKLFRLISGYYLHLNYANFSCIFLLFFTYFLEKNNINLVITLITEHAFPHRFLHADNHFSAYLFLYAQPPFPGRKRRLLQK